MDQNLSSETLVDGAQLTPANGGETVGTPVLSLDELNKHLGSDFKDPATALKSLKDTKDFVGKRKEDIAAEVKASLIPVTPSDVASKSDVQALQKELFLSQNPQYKGYEGILEKISPNFSEAVNDETFKTLFEKAKSADEVTNQKSVVSSNSRLSQSKTVIDEAITVANARGTTNEDTAMVFASAINAQNNQG